MKKFLLFPFVLLLILFSNSAVAQVTQIDNNHSLNGYPIGGKIFLISDNDGSLWTSDGTAINTVNYTTKVVSDENGSGGVLNNKIYFAGIDATHGSELWITDGTDGGTSLVQDINAGAGNSIPDNFFLFKNDLYFTATNPTYGRELYKISGSNGTVTLFKDINPGTGSAFSTSDPIQFFSLNNLMYFLANDGTHGSELWVSDGTSGNTNLLSDITAGTTGTKFGQFAHLGNTIIFGVITASNTLELWKTDGTTLGTAMFYSFDAVPMSGFAPGGFLSFNNKLYFAGADVTNGIELWATDGTAGGTALIKDINPGSTGPLPNSSYPVVSLSVIINNHFLFDARTEANGMELWSSDGSASGTTLLKDIYPGTGDASPFLFPDIDFSSLINEGDLGNIFSNTNLFNGFIFLSANDGTNGTQLWKTDGTAGGTTMVKNIGGTSGGVSGSYYYTSSGLYFSADDGADGEEPWFSDGTSGGTNMVQDVNVGSGGSDPQFMFIFNNNLFLTADNGDSPVDGYTDFYKINATVSTLPVTLLNFSAIWQHQSVALSWITSMELNSDHFEIQRSTDGVHFTDIGRVEAAGNSSVEKKYNYIDDQYPAGYSGVLYYRLQMVDKDGKYKYSDVLNVRLASSATELRIYPNPVHNQLHVLFSAPSSDRIALRITDVSGKQVFSNTYSAGSSSVMQNIDVSGLSKGSYFIQMIAGKESRITRFVKE